MNSRTVQRRQRELLKNGVMWMFCIPILALITFTVTGWTGYKDEQIQVELVE